MQILPNGMVRISNHKTGESKDVNPGDLPGYGPGLFDTYATLKSMNKPQAAAANPGAYLSQQSQSQAQQPNQSSGSSGFFNYDPMGNTGTSPSGGLTASQPINNQLQMGNTSIPSVPTPTNSPTAGMSWNQPQGFDWSKLQLNPAGTGFSSGGNSGLSIVGNQKNPFGNY